MADSTTPNATPARKRRSTNSIDEKRRAVEELAKGVPVAQLAALHGVSPSTIRRWSQQGPKLAQFDANGADPKRAKHMKGAQNVTLEERLHKWVQDQRVPGQSKPVSLIALQEMGLQISADLGAEGSPDYRPDFKASAGWAQNFIKRHGLHSLDLVGEALSADVRAAEGFVEWLRPFLEENDIDPGDVYNFDEGGVCYKALPTRTYALPEERTAKGTKVQKERITMGVCANATGTTQIPLLIIGKYAKPRCFRHGEAEIRSLPVVYTHQRKAWMEQRVFEDWLVFTFMPLATRRQEEEGRGPGKILLLMDNATAHMPDPSVYRNERLLIHFMPPNTTSLIQPMDQGVIAKIKRLYRRALVRRLLAFPGSCDEFYKTVTVKDACKLLHDAWIQVTQGNIQNAFRKIMPPQDGAPPAPPAPPASATPPAAAAPQPDSSSAVLEVRPEETLASASREEARELGAQLRQRQDLSALTDDDVWAFFEGVNAVEAVPDKTGAEEDEGEDDGEEDEDEDEFLADETTLKIWAKLQEIGARKGALSGSYVDFKHAIDTAFQEAKRTVTSLP